MKITEYQKVQTLTDDNVFVLDGNNGTRGIEAPYLAKSLERLAEAKADAKTTPVDADTIPIFDSAASSIRKKLTWDNLVLAVKNALATVYAAKTHSHSADDVGAVPTTRKINNKLLSADFSLDADDVGALASGATSAAAAKLATPRPLQVNLASEGAPAFDGTAGVEPGVKGILPAIHGGIGAAAEMHRMIFRGKNLGTALTSAQKTAIQNGTFDDLYVGDYWVINGINWRIVDIDYWWNCGDSPFTKHHLVIMPDTNLGGNKQMNTENVTTGGYIGSLMYTTNMNDAKALCTGAFESNILTHRDIFCNAVTNGRPTGYAWLDSSIELPTEVMIYGCPHYAVMNDGTNIPMKYAISKSQLALFALAPKFITTRQTYWLQDVVSAAAFADVGNSGISSCYGASHSWVGVRPVFAVGV